MHPVLQKKYFHVQEHAEALQAANDYDVYDLETGEQVMHCREENLGILQRMLRFTDYKTNTAFDLIVRTASGERILSVHRGFTVFRSTITVRGQDQREIGQFQQKVFSMGGVKVFDARGREAFQLDGSLWKRDFQFLEGGRELGNVSKKFSGVSRELLTSADEYVLEVQEHVPPDSIARPLMLAAALCIDMVHHED